VPPAGADLDPPAPAPGEPVGLPGLPGRADGDGGLSAGDEPRGGTGLAEVERAGPGAPLSRPLPLEAQRDTNT
jgi:hypothetical protein